MTKIVQSITISLLSLLKFALHRSNALMQYSEISDICKVAKPIFDEKSVLPAFVLGQSRSHIPIGSFQE